MCFAPWSLPRPQTNDDRRESDRMALHFALPPRVVEMCANAYLSLTARRNWPSQRSSGIPSPQRDLGIWGVSCWKCRRRRREERGGGVGTRAKDSEGYGDDSSEKK